jgi:hypothetical protein
VRSGELALPARFEQPPRGSLFGFFAGRIHLLVNGLSKSQKPP